MSSDAGKHICKLPPEEDIVVTFINDGYFVPLRRKIKSFFMINEHGRYAKMCFKSNFLIKREKKNHLKHNYYMIHPHSKAKEYCDIFICIVLFLSLIMEKDPENVYMDTAGRLTNTLLVLDLVKNFVTGIYREEFNDTVLRPKSVARHYLKSWFIIDILTVVPEFIRYRVEKYVEDENIKLICFFVINVSYFSRVVKIIRLLNTIQKHWRFKVYHFKVARLLIIAFVIIVWLSYPMHLITEVSQEEWMLQLETHNHLLVIYRSFLLFFLYGDTGEMSSNIFVVILEITLLLLGYGFYLYFSIQFIHLINYRNAITHKNELIKERLTAYASYKRLPQSITYGLIKSYEFVFQKSYFNETKIMESISGQLKREIIEFYAQRFVMKLDVFNDLPAGVIAALLIKMRRKIYFTGDIIYKATAKNRNIYFLYMGTIATFSIEGREIMHMYDGNYFGSASIFNLERQAIGTAKAIEICQIYKISYDDLVGVLDSYPAVLENLLQKGKHRMEVNRNQDFADD